MTDYSANNKKISDKISKKDKRSYKDNRIIIPLRLRISERTQRILPYPPHFSHYSKVESGSKAIKYVRS